MHTYRSLILSALVILVIVLCTIMGADQLLREDGDKFIGGLLVVSPWLTIIGCLIQ